jgi:hypothetical protein
VTSSSLLRSTSFSVSPLSKLSWQAAFRYVQQGCRIQSSSHQLARCEGSTNLNMRSTTLSCVPQEIAEGSPTAMMQRIRDVVSSNLHVRAGAAALYGTGVAAPAAVSDPTESHAPAAGSTPSIAPASSNHVLTAPNGSGTSGQKRPRRADTAAEDALLTTRGSPHLYSDTSDLLKRLVAMCRRPQDVRHWRR